MTSVVMESVTRRTYCKCVWDFAEQTNVVMESFSDVCMVFESGYLKLTRITKQLEVASIAETIISL